MPGGRPRYDVHTRDFWYKENGEDGKLEGENGESDDASGILQCQVETTLSQAFTLAGVASKGCCCGSTGPAHAERSKDDQA